MLYSRSLLFIYFIYSMVNVAIFLKDPSQYLHVTNTQKLVTLATCDTSRIEKNAYRTIPTL